jgi:hypothetical protein
VIPGSTVANRSHEFTQSAHAASVVRPSRSASVVSASEKNPSESPPPIKSRSHPQAFLGRRHTISPPIAA